MTIIRTLIAALALSLAAPAYAQIYLFGAGSHAKAETRTSPTTSGSDTTAFHVGAGWRFTPHFSAELGYLGLGHYGSADAFTQWTAEGPGLAAVGTLPVAGPWSLVGKLGAYRLDARLERCCTTVEKEKLGTRPLIALGVQYHVGDALSVQMLYQRIEGKTGSQLDELRLISLGAMLQF